MRKTPSSYAPPPSPPSPVSDQSADGEEDFLDDTPFESGLTVPVGEAGVMGAPAAMVSSLILSGTFPFTSFSLAELKREFPGKFVSFLGCCLFCGKRGHPWRCCPLRASDPPSPPLPPALAKAVRRRAAWPCPPRTDLREAGAAVQREATPIDKENPWARPGSSPAQANTSLRRCLGTWSAIGAPPRGPFLDSVRSAVAVPSPSPGLLLPESPGGRAFRKISRRRDSKTYQSRQLPATS